MPAPAEQVARFPLGRSFVRGFCLTRLAEGRFEGEGEVPGPLESEMGVLLQAMRDDSLEAQGDRAARREGTLQDPL